MSPILDASLTALALALTAICICGLIDIGRCFLNKNYWRK